MSTPTEPRALFIQRLRSLPTEGREGGREGGRERKKVLYTCQVSALRGQTCVCVRVRVCVCVCVCGDKPPW